MPFIIIIGFYFFDGFMFQVHNRTSGKHFAVAADESLLDGALRAGIYFPYGCRKGSCGKCKARILSGRVDYNFRKFSGISKNEHTKNFALLCQCRAKSDIELAINEIDVPTKIKIRTLKCTIDNINFLNRDVAQMFLKIQNGKTLQYFAGQYLDLSYPDFEPRAFSIANAPANSDIIELHIRLIENGRLTNFIFSEACKHSTVEIVGPKGDFFLREGSERPIIIVAGGTGFGPVKAIIERMIQIDSKRRVHLYWGVRDMGDLYMDAPKIWGDMYDHISFIPVLSQGGQNWKGRRGFVHQAVLEDFDNLRGYEIYACGPPPMVTAAAVSFSERGMLQERFFSDAFDFAFSS